VSEAPTKVVPGSYILASVSQKIQHVPHTSSVVTLWFL